MNMHLCAAEDLHQIIFSASRLPGNLMLECLHFSSTARSLYEYEQRRIFIFGALGYFKLGALLEGRGGRSHIFRHRYRSDSKIIKSGSEKCSNLSIRLLFRLWIPSM